jgi:hypothetical protein
VVPGLADFDPERTFVEHPEDPFLSGGPQLPTPRIP